MQGVLVYRDTRAYILDVSSMNLHVVTYVVDGNWKILFFDEGIRKFILIIVLCLFESIISTYLGQ